MVEEFDSHFVGKHVFLARVRDQAKGMISHDPDNEAAYDLHGVVVKKFKSRIPLVQNECR